MFKKILICSSLLFPATLFASTHEQILSVVEKALTPGARDKFRAYDTLESISKVEPETIVAAMRALVSNQDRWSFGDIRSHLFIFLYSRGQKLEFDLGQSRRLTLALSKVLTLVANPRENIAFDLAVYWKSGLIPWSPKEYPLIFDVIKHSGVASFGANIEAIAAAMGSRQRTALRKALVKRSKYETDEYSVESGALVLCDLATEDDVVNVLRRTAGLYQNLDSQIARLYFPASAFVPSSFLGIVFSGPEEIESYLAQWGERHPVLQKTELTERTLEHIHLKLKRGDPMFLNALVRARADGPKSSFSNPQVYQEFLNRLVGAGFTIEGQPPLEAALKDEGVLRVDFVKRRIVSCEGSLR